MANFVKFQLKDGTEVYIESTDTPRGSGSLIPAKGTDAAEQPGHSFEDSISAVHKMAVAMIDKFYEGFVEQPSEVAISFGLKASAELGNLAVSRTGMEANFNVSLRWYKKKDEPKDEKGAPKEEETETLAEGKAPASQEQAAEPAEAPKE